MNPVPFEGRRGLARLLGATLLALTLAACGGGDGSPEPAASGDHITGTLGSEVKAATQYVMAYQNWDEGAPSGAMHLVAVNGADPVNFDYDFYWFIANLPATAGTHVCGSTIDLTIALQLQDQPEGSPDGWSTNGEAGTCSVTITSITDQAIEGSFSATLVPHYGMGDPEDALEPRQVTNASFRITRSFIQGSVDGAPVLRAMYDAGGYLSGSEGEQLDDIDASAYDASGYLGNWNIWNLPTAPGTYQCGQGAGKHNVWIYWDKGNEDEDWAEAGRHEGSSCTVTVTRVANGFVEGTFSATMVHGDGWHDVDDDFSTFDTITKTYSVTGGSFRMPMNNMS